MFWKDATIQVTFFIHQGVGNLFIFKWFYDKGYSYKIMMKAL